MDVRTSKRFIEAMKKSIFIFVLLIMACVNAAGQGMWDRVEVITDKFNNIKQSILVHYFDGEIDAVWFEDSQQFKYIGKFPPEEAYSFTKTNTEVGFYIPRKRDVVADINRSGTIEKGTNIEMTFPKVTSPTFQYSFFLWIPMTLEQMKKGDFIACRYFNMGESLKYDEPRFSEFNVSLKGFTLAYNKKRKM